ncbi:hypothetical protein OSG_eHP31_00070 [environmental Halophage eHP-31]|nr:hypothetical protein OSG_eHP31_00070 [environmental Halophage eHP-31]
MTANNFSASGRVLFQSGDDLDEANLSEILAKGNQTNYVERGLSVSLDAAAGTVDIGPGHAVIEDSNAAFDLFPPSASGLPVPNSNGNNYIYLEHDPATQDEIQFHIDDNDTAPGNPALKIAVADTNANSVVEVNRAPDIEAAEAAIDRLGQNLNGQGFDVTNLGSVDTDELSSNIETGSDVSGSRSFDTDYQNNSGRLRSISVRLKNGSGSSGTIDARLIVGDSSSSKEHRDNFKATVENGNGASLRAIVPDGYHYEVESFGVEDIVNWMEADWT